MPESPDPSTARWKDWLFPALIAGTPIAVGILQLYLASRGNPVVHLALVSQIDLVTMWTMVLFRLLPYLAATVLPMVLLCRPLLYPERYLQSQGTHSPLFYDRRRLLVALTAHLILGSLFLRMTSIIFGIVVLFTLVGLGRIVDIRVNLPQFAAIEPEDRRSEAVIRDLQPLRRGLRVTILAIVLANLARAALSPDIAVPAEWLKIRGEPDYVQAYILNVDDISLGMYLRDEGIVRKVANDDIEDRLVCPSARSYFQGRGIDQLRHMAVGDVAVPAACRDVLEQARRRAQGD